MNILIACEASGEVRRAMRARGHNAWSCDVLPSEDNSKHHYQADVMGVLEAQPWDMMIAFPPCTHLCVSGARWFANKAVEQAAALAFVEALWESGIPKIAIENPIGVLSTRSRLGKPDQIIQPWQHGHGETKATCLWLRGLPKLAATNIVPGREARVHKMAPSPTRAASRSRTYSGIAAAMAAQWG